MSYGKVIDLGFQGRFSTRLGAELSFHLSSISPFHTLYHCQIMFCLHHKCTDNCQQPCPNINNLLPQYYTQNPIIQNPNQNHTCTTHHIRSTPMPKHRYTKLNNIQYNKYSTLKQPPEKINIPFTKINKYIYTNGHYQTITSTQDG
jgi:hypothetical protein